MIVYNNQQQLTGHCSFQEYSVLLQSLPRNNGNQGQHSIIPRNPPNIWIKIIQFAIQIECLHSTKCLDPHRYLGRDLNNFWSV